MAASSAPSPAPTAGPRTAANERPRILTRLSLLGGAPEARYRKLRPGLEELPWHTLDAKELAEAHSAAELAAARSGWTAAALQEYASASAQASMLRALIRARVPLDLSGMAAGFALDELAHAELCARMAEGLGGGTGTPCDDRHFPSPPNRSDPLLEAAGLVVWNCCVSESWSTVVLREMQRRASGELARGVWWQIARDETLHGQFGWLFLDWLQDGLDAADRRFLGRTADRALAAIRRGIAQGASVDPAGFGALGVMPGFRAGEFVTFAERALEACSRWRRCASAGSRSRRLISSSSVTPHPASLAARLSDFLGREARTPLPHPSPRSPSGKSSKSKVASDLGRGCGSGCGCGVLARACSVTRLKIDSPRRGGGERFVLEQRADYWAAVAP